MPITHVTPENISKYLCAAGSGSKEAIKDATSPRGILEWLVNFFTFGGVRRSNERSFREVVEKLTTALINIDETAFYSGTRIFLEEINGCTTRLVCGAASDDKEPVVTIEVCKNGDIVASEVDGDTFWGVCRMLKLMSTYNIEQPDSLLTEDGFLNLRGLNLAHKDFRGEDLSEIDASGSNFCGTILSGVKIHDAKLCGANLCGATLCHANINFVSLTEANLADVNLTGAEVVYANLTRANLIDANLTGTEMRHVDLTNANLTNANLTDAVVRHADLTGANLSRANLANVTLTNAKLDDDAKGAVNVGSAKSESPKAKHTDIQDFTAPPDDTNENIPPFLPDGV
ncbi:TPA: SPI-2 type III secretion system effector PipB [Salmonella enterica]|nr:SPI-2 type III secretion system effector PipB [Salmonella enterica]